MSRLRCEEQCNKTLSYQELLKVPALADFYLRLLMRYLKCKSRIIIHSQCFNNTDSSPCLSGGLKYFQHL